MTQPPSPETETPRIDPATGLPLPDPYPEYVQCPKCGEMEVEVYCFETVAHCHNCGAAFEHKPPLRCGTYPFCKRGKPEGSGQSAVNSQQ